MIKLTATGSGYYRVYLDGVEVSQHTTPHKAAESAVNVKMENPGSRVSYDHDYNVVVEVTNEPVEDVEPPPVEPPVEEPTEEEEMPTGENTGESTGEGGGQVPFLLPPTNFSLSGQTQNRMTATWTLPLRGGATQILVKNNADDSTLATATWPATSITVTGLTAATNYTMYAVTSNGTNVSAKSNTFSLQTNPATAGNPRSPNYIPDFAESFNGGSLGATAALAGPNVIQPPVYSNDINGPFGSTSSVVRQDMSITTKIFGGNLHNFSSLLTEGDKVWVAWYEYFPSSSFTFANGINGDASGGTGKIKWMRFQGQDNSHRLTGHYDAQPSCAPTCTSGFNTATIAGIDGELVGHQIPDGRYPGGQFSNSNVAPTISVPLNTWTRMQMYLEVSDGDVDTGDGTGVMRMWQDYDLQLDYNKSTLPPPGLGLPTSTYLRYVMWGNYWNGGAPIDCHWYMSEAVVVIEKAGQSNSPDTLDAFGNPYIHPDTQVGDF